MAVANPTRDTTEIAAELGPLIRELPDNVQLRFLDALDVAVGEARRGGDHGTVIRVLDAWLGLVLARRGPNYEQNMARGHGPLRPSHTLQGTQQPLQRPPSPWNAVGAAHVPKPRSRH